MVYADPFQVPAVLSILSQLCLSFGYQFVPRDPCRPHVSPAEVDDEQADGENPVEDGHKHHPAQRRHVGIFCPANQNPHQQTTRLEEKAKVVPEG